MSQLSLDPQFVWVIDTTALVEMKILVSIDHQWDAFSLMSVMARASKIAIPRQTIKETTEITHPDMPGAWAAKARSDLVLPLDADYALVRDVLAEFPGLVDVGAEKEQADPYVVALAMQLNGERIARVVSEDLKDRPPYHTSILTACRHFKIDHWRTHEFLDEIGVKRLKERERDT